MIYFILNILSLIILTKEIYAQSTFADGSFKTKCTCSSTSGGTCVCSATSDRQGWPCMISSGVDSVYCLTYFYVHPI